MSFVELAASSIPRGRREIHVRTTPIHAKSLLVRILSHCRASCAGRAFDCAAIRIKTFYFQDNREILLNVLIIRNRTIICLMKLKEKCVHRNENVRMMLTLFTVLAHDVAAASEHTLLQFSSRRIG